MDTLTRDDLKYLAETENGWHVSLFMPAYATSPDSEQNPIRFHNLLRQAEDRLLAVGLHATEAHELLAPAYQLLKDSSFWQQQAGGLATYLAYEQFRVYRVPIALDERVALSHRFAVSPLLPLLDSDAHYYVLALDQRGAELYRCTAFSCTRVDVPGAPDGLADTLKFDILERQEHSYTVPAGSPRGTAIHYGVGSRADEVKVQQQRYFRGVDRAVRARLADESAPLVLAGVDSLLPLYREVNTYPHLMADSMSGAVKTARPDQLQREAWPIVEPLFRQARDLALARYEELDGTGLTATSVADILPAAHDGRVAALFAREGEEAWGCYDTTLQQVTVHETRDADDIDLVELAAVQTLLHDGAIYIVPAITLSNAAPLAAVYRY